MTKQERKAFPLRLSEDAIDELRTFAFYTDQSMNEVANEAIRAYFDGAGRAILRDAIQAKGRKDYARTLEKLAQ